MKRLIRWSWQALTVVMCVGSLCYAQQQNMGGSTTPSGLGSGSTSTGRSSGVGRQRLGTSSTTARGLGSGSTIDRTSTTDATNPLAGRGLNVLSGDAIQQQSGVNRTQGNLSAGFGAGGQGGRGSSGNQARRQTQNFAQYSTNITFAPQTGSPVDSPATSAPIVASLETRVAALPQSGVRVSVEDGTVVLRGTVATESDRRVAERMAKLEPGIDRVQNELVVSTN
jgi:osmotically-inducible protein OsmY